MAAGTEGRALLLSGPSGAGKTSTLAAAAAVEWPVAPGRVADRLAALRQRESEGVSTGRLSGGSSRASTGRASSTAGRLTTRSSTGGSSDAGAGGAAGISGADASSEAVRPSEITLPVLQRPPRLIMVNCIQRSAKAVWAVALAAALEAFSAAERAKLLPGLPTRLGSGGVAPTEEALLGTKGLTADRMRRLLSAALAALPKQVRCADGRDIKIGRPAYLKMPIVVFDEAESTADGGRTVAAVAQLIRRHTAAGAMGAVLITNSTSVSQLRGDGPAGSAGLGAAVAGETAATRSAFREVTFTPYSVEQLHQIAANAVAVQAAVMTSSLAEQVAVAVKRPATTPRGRKKAAAPEPATPPAVVVKDIAIRMIAQRTHSAHGGDVRKLLAVAHDTVAEALRRSPTDSATGALPAAASAAAPVAGSRAPLAAVSPNIVAAAVGDASPTGGRKRPRSCGAVAAGPAPPAPPVPGASVGAAEVRTAMRDGPTCFDTIRDLPLQALLVLCCCVAHTTQAEEEARAITGSTAAVAGVRFTAGAIFVRYQRVMLELHLGPLGLTHVRGLLVDLAQQQVLSTGDGVSYAVAAGHSELEAALKQSEASEALAVAVSKYRMGVARQTAAPVAATA